MRTDLIEAVGIYESGLLWVKPATATFPYIYREAMSVRWDSEHARLCSPKPQEWPYRAWFKQIRDAAREQGVELTLSPSTVWTGIDPAMQQTLASAD